MPICLVTSSNWINCPFSRPSNVRMSFCLISAKLISSGFYKMQNLSNCCKTQVWPFNFTENFLLRFCCLTCLSLANYLISKFWLPFIGVISAIVRWQKAPKKYTHLRWRWMRHHRNNRRRMIWYINCLGNHNAWHDSKFFVK